MQKLCDTIHIDVIQSHPMDSTQAIWMLGGNLSKIHTYAQTRLDVKLRTLDVSMSCNSRNIYLHFYESHAWN